MATPPLLAPFLLRGVDQPHTRLALSVRALLGVVLRDHRRQHTIRKPRVLDLVHHTRPRAHSCGAVDLLIADQACLDVDPEHPALFASHPQTHIPRRRHKHAPRRRLSVRLRRFCGLLVPFRVLLFVAEHVRAVVDGQRAGAVARRVQIIPRLRHECAWTALRASDQRSLPMRLQLGVDEGRDDESTLADVLEELFGPRLLRELR
mmetsp:Transcript_45426/g.91142  ORF Transcript_45426/g.91142 Transcript_45426/m.91142 type:complete len:205 (+) Transcript_45426:169-783(+)